MLRTILSNSSVLLVIIKMTRALLFSYEALWHISLLTLAEFISFSETSVREHSSVYVDQGFFSLRLRNGIRAQSDQRFHQAGRRISFLTRNEFDELIEAFKSKLFTWTICLNDVCHSSTGENSFIVSVIMFKPKQLTKKMEKTFSTSIIQQSTT